MKFVVIGASRGLGLCLTRDLLQEGHQVAAGTTTRNDALDALKKAFPSKLLIFDGDVTDEEQIAEGARQCQAFLGSIDALCHNAGVLLPSDRTTLLHQADIADLRRTLDVNTVGPVVVVKHFYPFLKEGANVFIITSEGTGLKQCGSWVPAYGLSKMAATKVSGILNASVNDRDFYSVHPGRMNTDMGRTTAQIEPDDASHGIVGLMTGEIEVNRENWYIDYMGRPMPMN